MWMHIISLLLIGSVASLEPTGNHVCQQEERYTVNVTQYFLRNATVRSYDWCVQFPPRCSRFIVKIINDTRIVEEERTRPQNVCCEGYKLEGDKCAPECLGCINGKCTDDNKCYCEPGFRGDHCEKVCEHSRWGRYCRYHCECARGRCDSETGHCYCPPGYTGVRCETQCRSGYFGEQCAGLCNCRENEFCNPLDGRCSEGFNETVKTTTDRKIVGLYLLTTTEVPAIIEATTEVRATSTTPDGVNIKSTDRPGAVTKPGTAKGKAASEVSGTPREKTRLNDEPPFEVIQRDSLLSRGLFVSLTGAIIAIVVLVLGIGRYLNVLMVRKSRCALEEKKNAAQTGNSIFHSSLPDPPLFEDATFDDSPQTLQEATRAPDRISRDYLEMFYDHPPSTGSYRAATMPEPSQEPVYDEIPGWKNQQDNLYMNTTLENKTRF